MGGQRVTKGVDGRKRWTSVVARGFVLKTNKVLNVSISLA